MTLKQIEVNLANYKTKSTTFLQQFVIRLENGVTITAQYKDNAFVKFIIDGKEELVAEVKAALGIVENNA